MIRVVHIITGLETGGAETMLYKLLCRMDRTRFANTVISLTGTGHLGRNIADIGVPVTTLNIKGLGTSLIALYRSIRLLRNLSPHVVQTWMHHADLFGTVATFFARTPNLAWNLRCASLSPDEVSRTNIRLVQILAQVSFMPELVIANSHAGQEAHLKAGYNPRSWAVVPNGFDVQVFSPNGASRKSARNELGLTDEDAVIGLVGRYHPMKGHALFLRAAQKLLTTLPQTKFLMIGRNVDNNVELSNEIRRLGLSENVLRLGERRDMPALMRALDVLTCSSTSEGFPNVIGEAMSCGVSCVATDVGDNRVIIGDTGSIIPPGDADALAEAWSHLLTACSKKREALGRSARDRVQALYDIKVVANRYEELYEKLASGIRTKNDEDAP